MVTILSALLCALGATLAAGSAEARASSPQVTPTPASPASKVSCIESSSAWSSAAWRGGNFNVQSRTLGSSRGTARIALDAPCAVRFLTQPANASAGARITGTQYSTAGMPVRVAVVDRLGKVVTSSSAPITIGLGANPERAALSGVTTVKAVHGIATFNDLTVSKASTGYTLTASAGRLAPATSRPFDESSTSTVCRQNQSCQTEMTSGPSTFQVVADGDASKPNAGTLSESVNVGTPLQCPGYTQEDPNWWEFAMTSDHRQKTISYTLKQSLLPLQGTLNAILQLTQVCFGATAEFITSAGTPAPPGTLPDGTSGFIGTLPNCPSSGPCVQTRRGPLEIGDNIGFDIVVTAHIPESLSGDPWMRG